MDIKFAIKAGLTAALSFSLGVAFSSQFDRPDNLVSGLWCILTSLVVLQPRVGGTYKAAWMRFLGILIGSFLGAVFTNLFGSSPLPLGISVACTVAICSLLNINDSIRIASMSVAIVMVLWGLHPNTSPWIFGIYRFLDSCLGITIAMVVTNTLWPNQATSNIQSNMSKYLQTLNRLYLKGVNLEITGEHLKKSSQDDIDEIYELSSKNHDFLDESKMELLVRTNGVEDWKSLIISCEFLFDQILSFDAIDKHVLSLIVDNDLAKKLEDTVNQTDEELKRLILQLNTNEIDESPPTSALQESVKALKADLIRFRTTKTTRKFELQDVESFFVFFHTVVLIADRLFSLKIEVRKALMN